MAAIKVKSWPKMTLGLAHRLVKEGQTTVNDLVNQSFSMIKERDNLNSFITVREESEVY